MVEATVALSDEQLVARTIDGDASAFNDLVARWETSLYNFVYRHLGDSEEARDICQEAFIRAYTNLHGFRGKAKFSSWLYQIALNLCRSQFRRNKARPTVSLEEQSESRPLRLVRDPGHKPDETTLTNERANLVRRALAELSDLQRTVIILKEYHGLKFREIAEILGAPESTVKSRLYHGLEALAQSLGHLK